MFFHISTPAGFSDEHPGIIKKLDSLSGMEVFLYGSSCFLRSRKLKTRVLKQNGLQE